MKAADVDWRKVGRDLRLTFFSHFFLKFVGYLVLVVLARYVEKGQVGEFFFALSLASLFVLCTELGTGNHLMRAVACEPGEAPEEFSRVLSLRLALAAPYFLALNGLVVLVRPEMALTAALVSIYVFLDQLYGSFASLFLGLGRADYSVAARVGSGLLLISSVFVAANLGWGLWPILGCYILSSAVLVGSAVWLVRGKIGPLRLRWDPLDFTRLAASSLPFFAATALVMVHANADAVSLGLLQPYAVVAAYAVGFKLLDVLRYMTRPVTAILYPLCSRMSHQGDWAGIEALLKRLLLAGLALGAIVSAGAIFTADFVVATVLGNKYQETPGLVKVLFLSVAPLYAGTLSTMFANSLHLERRVARVMLPAVAANVALSVAGVVVAGAMGAAWTTVLAESIIAAAVTLLVLKALRSRRASERAAHYPEEPAYATAEDSHAGSLPLPLA
ncbi:MAG TPA: oligosaccharide flippase family protein [Chloroflexia bacterium]|nr:oligosaccharide flippase family protein [Chloroflexia bacterium]